MQVKKQQLELDMEQQAGSKSGKEYIKAVYCHPAYLFFFIIIFLYVTYAAPTPKILNTRVGKKAADVFGFHLF